MTDSTEIRERLEKTTPGPWTTEKPGKGLDGFTEGVIVAATAPRQGIFANPPGGTFPESDRTFIAHAPTDIAFLLAENTRLTSALSEAEARAAGMVGLLQVVKNRLGAIGSHFHGCTMERYAENGPVCSCGLVEIREQVGDAIRALTALKGGGTE